MRIIKKLFGQRIATPKPAPCGHVPPVFPTKTRQYVIITMMPQELSGSGGSTYTIPGAVWCGNGCGWVKVSENEYKYFVSFNGNEES